MCVGSFSLKYMEARTFSFEYAISSGYLILCSGISLILSLVVGDVCLDLKLSLWSLSVVKASPFRTGFHMVVKI